MQIERIDHFTIVAQPEEIEAVAGFLLQGPGAAARTEA